MQYVNKAIQTSDHLNTGESRQDALYSKNENSLATHISNMSCGAIVAPKDFLTGSYTSAFTQSLLCEISEVSNVLTYQFPLESRKMFNLLFPDVISKIHFLISRAETILSGKKIIFLALMLNLGQSALYLAKNASVFCRLCAPHFALLTPSWLAKGKSFPSCTGISNCFSQALFFFAYVKIYRRITSLLESRAPG